MPRSMAATASAWSSMFSAVSRCALASKGYVIQTLCSQPSGTALFEYDYLIRFRGTGKLAEVQAALGPYKSARLVGAFEAR